MVNSMSESECDTVGVWLDDVLVLDSLVTSVVQLLLAVLTWLGLALVLGITTATSTEVCWPLTRLCLHTVSDCLARDSMVREVSED